MEGQRGLRLFGVWVGDSTDRLVLIGGRHIWYIHKNETWGSADSNDHLSSTVCLARGLQRIKRKIQFQSYQNGSNIHNLYVCGTL